MNTIELNDIAVVFVSEFVKMHGEKLQRCPKKGFIPFNKMNVGARRKLCEQVIDKLHEEARELNKE